MKIYEFGDVILTDFPFTGNFGHKKRPAEVISKTSFNKLRKDLVVMAITSQVNKLRYGDARIIDLRSAGLSKPSAYKALIMSINELAVYKRLGILAQQDKSKLRSSLKSIIDLG